jgi:hypothetical protein
MRNGGTMNILLKTKIYEKFRTQTDAAISFGMREDRLSKIIRERLLPTDTEKKLIAKKLKSSTEELFL